MQATYNKGMLNYLLNESYNLGSGDAELNTDESYNQWLMNKILDESYNHAVNAAIDLNKAPTSLGYEVITG